MKKCLFFLPYKLEEQGRGARMLRPRKMIQAFIDSGYKVELISGISSDRRIKINELKKQIAGGEKFSFCYAEANTEPTLLTDPNHMPTHPFLDFGFLKYVRASGIPIGLFYSDLFWKYDGYGVDLPSWKRRSALICYQYDIRQYEKILNRFYVPDIETFSQMLGSKRLSEIMKELPPGAEDLSIPDIGVRDFSERPLTVFYVGGLGGNYQISELIKAIRATEGVRLVLCCREAEWEKEKNSLSEWMCERVEVIHKSGDELEPYYMEADIGSLLFRRGSYMDMAKPFKAYEYLAHELPVLSTKGTSIGQFAEDQGLGWNIAYSADEISQVFREILTNPLLLMEKRQHCANAKKSNLWKSRAKEVEKDLTNSSMNEGKH